MEDFRVKNSGGEIIINYFVMEAAQLPAGADGSPLVRQERPQLKRSVRLTIMWRRNNEH